MIELLILLVNNNDRMVSKEEINEAVWHGRIVSEAALSSRIKTLRQLLDDDGKSQQVIQTVHRKGFRFLPDIERVEEGAFESEPAESANIDTEKPPPNKPAIAVLPFENLSADSDQEYFADGVSADIITHLSKHRWLNIVARNTSFGFKGKAIDAKSLGQQLNADYIVDGSIQRAGNRVRVSVNLIETANGLQTWSERYDRELNDIFTVQDEITEKITARLEPAIGHAERHKVVNARPANLQSWDCYHLGVYHFYQFTAEGNQQAQALLKRSQQLDENFGEAYVWWAYAVVLGMVYWDTQPTQALLDEALAACDTALSLDPHNASFYALRARVLLAKRDYKRAIAENQKAIDLNPTFAPAHCGLGDSLAYEGRYEDAFVCFEKAISLSPNDPQLWAFYSYGALMLIFKQDFQQALEWTEQAMLNPNCQYWALAHQAVAYAYLDNHEDAQASLNAVHEQVPDFSLAFAKEKMFYLKKQDQIDLYIQGLKKAGLEN
ncbi:MAG: tetratricopeptide repeat protein [Pseudomonadota bacterium]